MGWLWMIMLYIYITVYLLNKDTAIVHVQLVIRDDRVHVFEHCCLVIFTTLSLQMWGCRAGDTTGKPSNMATGGFDHQITGFVQGQLNI